MPDGVATNPASLTSRLFCPANEKPNGFGVGAWWPTAGPAAPCQLTENTSITPLGAGSPRMVTTSCWPLGEKPICRGDAGGLVGSADSSG